MMRFQNSTAMLLPKRNEYMKCSHRDMKMNFHKSHHYGHPKLEIAQMYLKRQIVKEMMVHVYNSMLFTNK